MKKILKNILISITIIYFIFSILYNGVFKVLHTERVDMLTKTQSEIYNIKEEMTYGRMLLNSASAMLSIVNVNLVGILCSLIIGTIVGLIVSVKENSKIKYILYFIFGIIIYNAIWTFIISSIYDSYGLLNVYTNYNIIETWEYAFEKTFISYILIYIIVIVANVINNKIQVKNLNENLNKNNGKNKEDKEDKKRFKISDKIKNIIKIGIISIIIISILVVSIVIAQRTIILINYSKAINELNKYQNYYIKEEQNFTYEPDSKNNKNYIIEKYYKDNILVKKQNNSISYQNEDTKESLHIDQINKKVYQYKCNVREQLLNQFYGDDYVRFWKNIILAFNVDIKTQKYDGKEYYKITKDNQTVYLDKESYLPVIYIQKSDYGKYDYENKKMKTEYQKLEEKYTYNFNIVTDEDIQKPDITDYIIEDMRQNQKI